MLDQIGLIGNELFGQAPTLAQLAALLFLASIVLLLLSLVSFQLSRIKEREVIRIYPKKEPVPDQTPKPTRPVMTVSWAAAEAGHPDQPSDIVPDAPRPEAPPPHTAAPVNDTDARSDDAGTSETETDTAQANPDATDRKQGPVFLKSRNSAVQQDPSAETPAGSDQDNHDGFIFLQRNKKHPPKTPNPSAADEDKAAAAAAEASHFDTVSFAASQFVQDDSIRISLQKIEAQMQQLKQFYLKGHIEPAFYIEQSQSLYHEALQLMTKDRTVLKSRADT